MNTHIILHIDGEDYPLELLEMTLTLDSMPLDVADSSGSVGDMTFTTPQPEDPDHPLFRFGAVWAKQKKFTAHHGTGQFTGYVLDATSSDTGGTITFTGTTIGHELNLYNIAMPPMKGTLQSVLREYLDNIGATSINLEVDPSVASRDVVYPGWTGEFWLHLKMLCAAEEIDLVLINDKVEIFPTRMRESHRDWDVSREYTMEGSSYAQFVEVYDYNNHWVDNKLVYPPGGWDPDVPVLSVGAGETVEHTIELSTSLIGFQEPEMRTHVTSGYDGSSVYTVVGDDGFPIQPAQWAAYGGKVSVRMGDEFHTMIVEMRGANGIISGEGEEIKTFALALNSDSGVSGYSTLRLVGTGVAYDRTILRVATGVPDTRASTEVGVTIDNPFLRNTGLALNAAVRSATKFQGYNPIMTVSSEGILSDDAILDQETLTHFVGESHVYRTRKVTHSPGGVEVEAEGDTRISDVAHLYSHMTCGEFNAAYPNMTCMDFRAMGLRLGG